MRIKISGSKIFLIMLLMLFSSCNYGPAGVNKSKEYSVDSLFIIDYNVILYADAESDKEVKKLNYFEPFTIISGSLSGKNRINIKLTDGTGGWVEEINTSYIPGNWKKLISPVDYFCYAPPESKLGFKKDMYKNMQKFYYWNKNYETGIGVSLIDDYKSRKEFISDNINNKIESGQDKNKNFIKEFTYGNYLVTYKIETESIDGGVVEAFYFIKKNEITEQKNYSIYVEYSSRYQEKRIQLLNRKILFSVLRSLK